MSALGGGRRGGPSSLRVLALQQVDPSHQGL